MENISNFFAKKCCKKYKKMILYIGQKKGLWFQMKNEKGITLVTLVITIVVLAIIASITITRGIDAKKNVKDTKSAVLEAEITQVQQIV